MNATAQIWTSSNSNSMSCNQGAKLTFCCPLAVGSPTPYVGCARASTRHAHRFFISDQLAFYLGSASALRARLWRGSS